MKDLASGLGPSADGGPGWLHNSDRPVLRQGPGHANDP